MTAIADVQQLAPIVIDDGVTPVTIGSISQMSLNTGTEVIREVAGGQVYQSQTFIGAVMPVCSFTTWSIADAIDNFNVFRYCIPSGTSVKVYTATRECGGNKAGATHTEYEFANGIIVPRSLRCDHRGHAQISYDLFPVSTTGSAAPFTQALTESLPTDFGDNDSRWTLADLQFGAVNILNKQSVEIDFGVEVIRQAGDSHVYDTFAGMRSAQPRVTIGCINPDDFANIGLSGLSGTHANSYIYFRKRGVSDATEEHIGIATAGLAYTETVADGSNTSDALSNRIILEPYYDGTDAPFVIDTTQALS